MHKTKIILIMVFFVALFVGCLSKGSIRNDTNKLKDLNNIKSVSVLKFKCSNPDIANNIRNMIIDSLLTQYSVVIGDEADVVIKGTITLSDDQVESASPGSTEGYITGISAQIIKNNNILDSVTVNQVRDNVWNPASAEVMGRDMGEKIKKALSHILS